LPWWSACTITVYIRAIKSINQSTTSAEPGALPQPLPVWRALVKFGHDLALTHRRRYSQVSMAERVGISVATLRSLEKGDGSVA
jgi:hypothetical protein